MKTEWERCKLGDICNISSSKRIFLKEYCDWGIPFYRGKEIIEKNKGNKISTELFISESRYKEISEKFDVPQLGDILLTSVGTLGVPWIIDEEKIYFKDGNLTWLRCDHAKLDNHYLYFWFSSPFAKNQIDAMCIGSTQKALTINTLNKFQIFLPPLSVQKKIAGILKSLDDKIEQNRQISKNLEEQARCLFNEQFDKANDQLPDRWQIADIYSIANVIYGAPFASNLFNTEGNGKPIIRIRDLQSQNFTTYTTENHLKGYLLQRGDIVVGMDGEFRPYIWGNDEAWLNQRICVFENKRTKGKFFLYFTLLPLLNFIEETEMATTVIHIGKKDFDAFRIILPDEQTLNNYDELTMTMFAQIVAHKKESARVTQIRDTILPKLMSGEIEV